jgi:phosphopentomutase
MATKINKTAEVLDKLKGEGKVVSMGTVQDIATISALTDRMKSVRRDYQIKERNSQMRAAQVILTA